MDIISLSVKGGKGLMYLVPLFLLIVDGARVEDCPLSTLDYRVVVKDDVCYGISYDIKTYDDSGHLCKQTHNTQLAKITDEQTHFLIYSELQKLRAGGLSTEDACFHLQGTRTGLFSSWIYDDGDKVAFVYVPGRDPASRKPLPTLGDYKSGSVSVCLPDGLWRKQDDPSPKLQYICQFEFSPMITTESIAVTMESTDVTTEAVGVATEMTMATKETAGITTVTTNETTTAAITSMPGYIVPKITETRVSPMHLVTGRQSSIVKKIADNTVLNCALWAVPVHSSSACFRACDKSEDACSAFSYNRNTKKCMGFSPTVMTQVNRVIISGWTLWQVGGY